MSTAPRLGVNSSNTLYEELHTHCIPERILMSLLYHISPVNRFVSAENERRAGSDACCNSETNDSILTIGCPFPKQLLRIPSVLSLISMQANHNGFSGDSMETKLEGNAINKHSMRSHFRSIASEWNPVKDAIWTSRCIFFQSKPDVSK